VVDNDANCAVIAEWKMGNGRNKQNVVLLTLGTGIGGGLILNGQLFRGSTGTAGELGHFSIHSDGKWCPCGNRGCFERYCSATALREAGEVSAREVFARGDEEFFKGIIVHFLRDFQVALTSLANAFDPDCILLGGAVTQGLVPYLTTLDAWVKKHAFPSVAAHMELGLAKFGNLSGSLGAALLALMDERAAA
jgi:glucokinase